METPTMTPPIGKNDAEQANGIAIGQTLAGAMASGNSFVKQDDGKMPNDVDRAANGKIKQMLARVRFPWLSAIEAKTTCNFKEVDIWEDDTVSVDDISQSYPIDFVKRLAPVSRIGQLAIFVTDWPKFLKDYGQLIMKEFRQIHMLRLVNEKGVNAEEVLTDSLFMEFSRRCQVVDVDIVGSVTAHGLYRLYQKMSRGSVPLMFFYVMEISREKRDAFLKTVGITFKDGVFSSKKKTFKVYSMAFNNYGHYYYIIDGSGMELSFYDSFHGRRVSMSIKAPKFEECPEYEVLHRSEYNFVAEERKGLKRMKIMH